MTRVEEAIPGQASIIVSCDGFIRMMNQEERVHYSPNLSDPTLWADHEVKHIWLKLNSPVNSSCRILNSRIYKNYKSNKQK